MGCGGGGGGVRGVRGEVTDADTDHMGPVWSGRPINLMLLLVYYSQTKPYVVYYSQTKPYIEGCGGRGEGG